MGQAVCGSTPYKIPVESDIVIKPNLDNLKFYYHPINPSCQAIAGLLKAGKIKHEAILVDILKGKQKNLDIGHFNPNASVPIIEIENQTFVESQAIMRMLCNLFDQLEHFYPKNAFQRHKIDSLLDWHQTTFGPTSKCALGCLFNLRKS